MNKNIIFKKKKIYLIGVGKVGSSLYHSLKSLGYDLQFASDTNIHRLKIITADDNKVKISATIKKEYLIKSDVIIYAVSEKSLRRVINTCRKFKLDLSKKIVFHLSGIETSDLFKVLNINNISIGSLHPLQTFNKISYKDSKKLKSIYFGIEGGSHAIKYFVNYCKNLKSKYILVPKDKKVLYHGACVIASNFMVSHFSIIAKILKEISLENKYNVEIFKPIIETTLDNIFKQGIEESLTGPFERGDVKSIDLHLKYFKEKLPSLLYYYILLGMEAMNMSLSKKSITEKEKKKIEKLFLNHI
ncbi:MAG: DUF2520 domain-containing protein [Ignavibacteria bacterium]|jgi:predicted short-subunit dehydrogenase-like oxidoreductase (DUF2520 family)